MNLKAMNDSMKETYRLVNNGRSAGATACPLNSWVAMDTGLTVAVSFTLHHLAISHFIHNRNGGVLCSVFVMPKKHNLVPPPPPCLISSTWIHCYSWLHVHDCYSKVGIGQVQLFWFWLELNWIKFRVFPCAVTGCLISENSLDTTSTWCRLKPHNIPLAEGECRHADRYSNLNFSLLLCLCL